MRVYPFHAVLFSKPAAAVVPKVLRKERRETDRPSFEADSLIGLIELHFQLMTAIGRELLQRSGPRLPVRHHLKSEKRLRKRFSARSRSDCPLKTRMKRNWRKEPSPTLRNRLNPFACIRVFGGHSLVAPNYRKLLPGPHNSPMLT